MAGTACSSKKVVIPISNVSPVASYCPHIPSLTFPSSVTISGNAKYQFRTNGNGDVDGTPANIRFAEIEVRNGVGALVQCAQTDQNGNFSFELPVDSGDFTVKVNSRANNANAKAYVMNDPTSNQYYSITATVSSASSSSVSLLAPATGSVIAGAFNILDKIVDANIFLREYASASACASFSDCETFTVAPLSYVYWTKGFNPNTYLGGGATNGVSFYLKGTNEMYILGGIEGDVDFSDSDHFDNSIILHEYGHFIENYYSVSDSPGGRHAPNEVLDPRLAWSEGFANFFQAAVTGDPLYRDTEGNISCNLGANPGCTGAFHNEDLEVVDEYDNPVNLAVRQGNFHEFAVTRVLWDAIDPHPVSARGGAGDPGNDLGTDSVLSPFAEFWTIFTGTTNGFRSSAARFRNVGLFHRMQRALTGGQDWATIRTNEDQAQNQVDYAAEVQLDNSCGSITIQANGGTDGSFEESHQFYDNDFFAYYHSSGTLSVRFTYGLDTGQPNFPADLDLIVWKNGYTYGDLNDVLASSRLSRATDSGDEEISVTAPAGWYMINVMALPYSTSAGGSRMAYTLFINGTKACATANP